MGDEILRGHAYFNYWALHGVLMKRRQPVLLSSQKVARSWLEKYAPRRITAKRTAPAVWGAAGEPLPKRPAVCAAVVELEGAAAVEDACGERYRREVTDKGLGNCFSIIANKTNLYQQQFNLLPPSPRSSFFVHNNNKLICLPLSLRLAPKAALIVSFSPGRKFTIRAAFGASQSEN